MQAAKFGHENSGRNALTSRLLSRGMMEGSTSETKPARTLQNLAEDALAEGKLELAGEKLRELRQLLDGDTGELVRLESSLHSLEVLAKKSVKGN